MRWWEQAKLHKGPSPRHGGRFYSIPLLIGLAIIAAKTPNLAGAPFAVVMTADSLSLVLMITAVLVLAVPAMRRAGSGPSAE
ncbi:hypothetical protein BKI49_12795 [Streptomyces sp. Tue6028]|nr:hypothetical protein BKI49_12795 [Streptomyces sp. Tue6028]